MNSLRSRITVIHVDALLKYNKYGSNVFVVGFLMIYPCRCDLTEYMYVYSAHCLLYSLYVLSICKLFLSGARSQEFLTKAHVLWSCDKSDFIFIFFSSRLYVRVQ